MRKVFFTRKIRLTLVFGFITSLYFWKHFMSPDYFAVPFRSFSLDDMINEKIWRLTDIYSNKNIKDIENKIKPLIKNITTGYRNNQHCNKKFNVSFLKVHKAGSTTVMNIFLRFAIQHELNIVLPRSTTGAGFNYLGYGKTVERERIVPLPTNESYNILCNHVVYNRTAFRSILPNDTIYVGILREPVSHFRSAALYYGFYSHLKNISEGVSQDKMLSAFLKNPSKRKISTYFVHNRMSFDFGIPKEKFHNVTFVESYIKVLSRDYSVMLILEYFPDSLVLMKKELCWNVKDILYVPLNTRNSKTAFELSNVDIELLEQWNSADFELYKHFLERFKEKVKSLGEDFQAEVQHFKTLRKEVETFCKENVGRNNTKAVFTVPKTKWDNSFIVTNRDCLLMMEHELSMVKRLIESAWFRYNASLTHK